VEYEGVKLSQMDINSGSKETGFDCLRNHLKTSGISWKPTQVDITLWGYWEDTEGHSLVEVGSIAKGTTNNGQYSFNPRTLATNDMLQDAWRKYQVSLSLL
jgi:hypothetical protein